jgi:hypothetical protein
LSKSSAAWREASISAFGAPAVCPASPKGAARENELLTNSRRFMMPAIIQETGPERIPGPVGTTEFDAEFLCGMAHGIVKA